MFFKNALVYQFTRNNIFPDGFEQLEVELKELSFKALGSQDITKIGWVSPLPGGKLLTHIADGRIMFALKEEHKILPAKAIKKELDERIAEIELEQGRKLRKKEKESLKEDVIISALPRCFTDEKITYGYLSAKQNMLIVNTSSHKEAEAFISLLRKTLGSLPVVPLQSKHQLDVLMTGWLVNQEHPGHFTIAHNAKLQSALKGGGKVTLTDEDLFSEPVHKHVEDKFVTEIGLKTDHLSFTLTEQLQLKGFNWADLLQEQNEDIDQDDFAARFDADFLLMACTLEEIIEKLFTVLSVIDLEEENVKAS
jgi:recombination associated protein RdgC